jgi:hypothetical protein
MAFGRNSQRPRFLVGQNVHRWLLVIHGGEAVVKRYAGMMAETDRHLLMSISTP